MVKKTVKWYRPVERCPKHDQQEVLFIPYNDGIMYKGIYNLDERTFALSSDYYHTYAPGAIAYWTPFPAYFTYEKGEQEVMDCTWFTTRVMPKDYSQILVIVRRFDGELFTQSGMFFLNNFEGRMKVYLYNSDNWLDFKNDIVGWMYYPKLPEWAREEAKRKVKHEERN